MAKGTTFLIFGEDHNDVSAIGHLVKAIANADNNIEVRPLRRPIILARDTEARKRKTMAAEIARFASAFEKRGRNVATIAHRDCDAVEPSSDHKDTLEELLKREGVTNAVAATPAWEIEAWWMLFPEAVAAACPCWRAIDYGRQDVGRIENAKERLTRDLRPVDPEKRSKCPEFRESDGIKIALNINKDRNLLDKIKAKSDSFNSFFKSINDIINQE